MEFLSLASSAFQGHHYALAQDLVFQSRWHNTGADYSDPLDRFPSHIQSILRNAKKLIKNDVYFDKESLLRIGEEHGWTPPLLVELYVSSIAAGNLEALSFTFDRGFRFDMVRNEIYKNRSDLIVLGFAFHSKVQSTPELFKYLFDKASNEPEIQGIVSQQTFDIWIKTIMNNPKEGVIRYLLEEKGVRFNKGHLREILLTDLGEDFSGYESKKEGDERFKSAMLILKALTRPVQVNVLAHVPFWATPSQFEALYLHISQNSLNSDYQKISKDNKKGNKIEKRKAVSSITSVAALEGDHPTLVSTPRFDIPSSVLRMYFESRYVADIDMVTFLIENDPATVAHPLALLEAFFLRNNLSVFTLLLSKFPRFLEQAFRDSTADSISSRVCQRFLDITTTATGLICPQKQRPRFHNFIECLKLTNMSLGNNEIEILRQVPNKYFQRRLSELLQS